MPDKYEHTHYSIHDGSCVQVIGRYHKRNRSRIIVRNECDDVWVADASQWVPITNRGYRHA